MSIIIFRFIVKSLFDSLSIKNIETVSVYGSIKNLENIFKSLTTNEISIELYITFEKINKSKFYGKKLVNIEDVIEELIEKYGISRIIIDKDCDSESTKRIYERIKKSTIKFSLSPDKQTLFGKKVEFLKNIPLEDLRDRNEIKVDINRISNFLGGKRILVTGGAGSIK